MIKRLVILTVAALSALSTGLFLPERWLAGVFHHLGYYFIFVSFFLWVVALIRFGFGRIRLFLWENRVALVLSLVLGALVFIISPPKFKILSDEANLVGVSKVMYEQKTASVPVQGFSVDYEAASYTFKTDKRPLLYALLMSILHSFLGYSAYHGFAVNFAACVASLFVFYVLIQNFSPNFYALLSMPILAGFPIFVTWFTSSGFEGINLFFVIFAFFVFHEFVIRKDVNSAELLLLSLVLLSQCRYESIIFVIGIVLVVPYLVNRETIGGITPITYCVPVLFIPFLWQQRLFANVTEPVRLGLDLLERTDQAFSLDSLASHFSTNVFVFLGFDSNLGFVPLIAFLALIGIWLLSKKIVLNYRQTDPGLRLTFLYGVITFIVLAVIIFSYHWGDFTVPVSNRLAMVFLPFIVFCAIHCLHAIFGETPGDKKKTVLAIFIAFHVLFYWPYGAQALLVRQLAPSYEYSRVLNFLKRQAEPDDSKVLIISDRANLYLIHGPGAVNFDYANKHRKKIGYFHENYYDRILVLQRIDNRTGQPRKDNRLDADYSLKKLERIKTSPEMSINILEVTAIEKAGSG